MAALERGNAAIRTSFERKQAEMEDALGIRVAAVAEWEKRMDELPEAVDAFPTVLETKVASAGERSPGWSTPERQGRVSREDRE